MVSKPLPTFPAPHARHDFGTLIRASFMLWRHSLRSTFWPALAYGLLSQLMLLPWLHNNPYWLPGITPEFVRQHTSNLHVLLDAVQMPSGVQQLELDGLTLGMAALGNLLALPFFLVVIQRQMQCVRGRIERPAPSWAVALRGALPVLLASLIYLLLNLLALAPLGLAWWLGLGSDEISWRLILILIGLLLSAAPLAWISIAACFYIPPILSEGVGPWAAVRQSIQQVRGRWIVCATLLTVTLLCWVGIYSAAASLPTLLTASIAILREDLFALLRTDWMVWGQLLSTPLLAATLPLLSAAYVVAATGGQSRERRLEIGES